MTSHFIITLIFLSVALIACSQQESEPTDPSAHSFLDTTQIVKVSHLVKVTRPIEGVMARIKHFI